MADEHHPSRQRQSQVPKYPEPDQKGARRLEQLLAVGTIIMAIGVLLDADGVVLVGAGLSLMTGLALIMLEGIE